MFLVLILLVLVVGQVVVAIKHQHFSLIYLVEKFLGIEKNWQDKLLGLLQMSVILLLSIGKAVRLENSGQRWIVFLLAFISYSLLLKVLISFILWLLEYLMSMTLGIAFSILIPTIILLFFSAIDTPFIRQAALMALILSVIMVYLEMLYYITGEEQEKRSKRVKIKSIMAWLVIILSNLYTLLVLVQFTGSSSAHHFIQAETFNEQSAIDLFYYLIITFTTVGFGDVCPQTTLAKMLTMLIALSGMLFSGMFVATILAVEEK